MLVAHNEYEVNCEGCCEDVIENCLNCPKVQDLIVNERLVK